MFCAKLVHNRVAKSGVTIDNTVCRAPSQWEEGKEGVSTGRPGGFRTTLLAYSNIQRLTSLVRAHLVARFAGIDICGGMRAQQQQQHH